MRWPVDGPIFGSKFGMRYHPTQHRWKLHEGQDFPNAPGTPLRAVADGTVTTNLGVASNPGGGNFITITLADGAQARYFHMRERSPLAVGTRVKQGQVVGYLGNTGTWTTGPHLHFEIRVNGSPVDPRAYIQARLGSTAGGTLAPGSSTKETKVKTYHKQDATARKSGRVLSPGERFYLHLETGKPQSNASNIVGNPGTYSITPHVYGQGEPGDIVELVLMWQKPSAKDPGKTNSEHYKERLTVDRDGYIRASREFKRGVSRGWAVYARLTAAHKNKGNVKITVFDSDAYLFIDA